MNILYISNEYPPDTGYGGIATYTRNMARAMVKLGHTVHVICRSEKSEGAVVDDEGVTVHRTVCGPYPLPVHKAWYPLRRLCYLFISQALHRLAWAKTAWKKFKELSRSIRFDIIEYPECGAEGFYFAKKCTVPTTVRLHTPWSLVREIDKIKEHPLDRFLQAYMEKTSISKADTMTSPSRALPLLLSERWNIPHATVYPNPINSQDYSSQRGNSQWIYTGRLEYRKGVHVLIEAYARVCTTHNPPSLLLAGAAVGTMDTGEHYGDYIHGLINDLDLKSKVQHLPGVPHSRIATLLNESSVAFFPSLWENFPYACMEAMACGLTVVASDCGGLPEMIVDGESGILCKAGDADALVASMRSILDNPEKASLLGKHARERVQSLFDLEIAAIKAQELYLQTIQKESRT